MSLFETLKNAIFHNPLASHAGSGSSGSQGSRSAAPATGATRATGSAPAAGSAAAARAAPATGAGTSGAATSASAPTTGAVTQPAGAPPRAGAAASPAGASTSAPGQPAAVDVEAVLEALNTRSSQKLNWRTSIVDLMKLVGLDSSLQHRQELASELGYTGDKNDSAAMNVWLHQAVMRKLAENGGKVPASLQ